ncbi:cytochrome c [Pontibacterium granulatum]|uniref:c-type cytochrome n=1 Tax=Pontibacterium granulatum TaxID=2036029 RepID=UPI00249B768D|nr:cytochrome c [Pontibacterium granulatum]MDI3323779.1 cytochrome c [Pontibacterium granulatum]
MLRKTLTVLVLSSAVIAAPMVQAHGGAKGVVKERMDLMDDMKGAIKTLSAIYKGERAYDAEIVRKAALVIRNHSGDAMTRLFPKNSIHGPSEAKPLIWQEWERFEKLAKRQQVISQGLHDAAENQQGAAQANGHMMGSAGMMGQKSMMGGGHMMGGEMDSAEHYAAMPSNMVFKMLTDNCSSCHTRYRVED